MYNNDLRDDTFGKFTSNQLQLTPNCMTFRKQCHCREEGRERDGSIWLWLTLAWIETASARKACAFVQKQKFNATLVSISCSCSYYIFDGNAMNYDSHTPKVLKSFYLWAPERDGHIGFDSHALRSWICSNNYSWTCAIFGIKLWILRTHIFDGSCHHFSNDTWADQVVPWRFISLGSWLKDINPEYIWCIPCSWSL